MAAGSAFVTGGTGALGQAVTGRFLSDGYRVGVSYRGENEWEARRREHEDAARTGSLLGVRADVTQAGSVSEAIGSAAKQFGDLRVLIQLAGGYRGGERVESVAEDTVRGMIELNLISAFWSAKHAIPHVKRATDGRLLFVSSRGAVECYPGGSAYAAAKLGLHALVQTLAKELKRDGVTANAVLPSVIDTAANRAAMPNSKFDEWLKPEAIADLLLFLASENAKATSGALIPIYG